VTDAAALATLRRAVAHVMVDDVDHPAIDSAAEHHLFRVLRIGDGELVTITDGRGRWRACRASGGGLVPEWESIEAAPREVSSTVAVAIPKADRPEWLVQKLTELGIDRIVLLHADRSVVHWDGERADRHVAKLRRTAIEALQQSRGIWLPEIVGPVPAGDVLSALAIAEPGGRPLMPTDRGIAVGPEGGWSDVELDSAADRVSLGPTVLRVETAALAAAARLVAVRDG
jgi:16S rRNA (uracil1498-N3)-methyltransferase